MRGPGWFRVISGARATFTRPGPRARVPEFSRARAMLRYRLLLARYVRTSVLAFSSSPLLVSSPAQGPAASLPLSRCFLRLLGPSCTPCFFPPRYPPPSSLRALSSLPPSLSPSLFLSLARSLSSRSPRSFPPTLRDLGGDPICRPF